jgi:hypothetical protein
MDLQVMGCNKTRFLYRDRKFGSMEKHTHYSFGPLELVHVKTMMTTIADG